MVLLSVDADAAATGYRFDKRSGNSDPRFLKLGHDIKDAAMSDQALLYRILKFIPQEILHALHPFPAPADRASDPYGPVDAPDTAIGLRCHRCLHAGFRLGGPRVKCGPVSTGSRARPLYGRRVWVSTRGSASTARAGWPHTGAGGWTLVALVWTAPHSLRLRLRRPAGQTCQWYNRFWSLDWGSVVPGR